MMQGALHLILPLVSMVSLCESLILGNVRPRNFTLIHQPENTRKVAFGQPDVNHYLQRQPGPQQYRNDSLFYADGPLFKWLPPGGRGKRYVTAEETKPEKQEEGLAGLFDNQGQEDLVRGKRKSLSRGVGYDGVPPITFELIQACRAARLDWPPCNLFFSYPWSVHAVNDREEGSTELEDEEKWLPDPEVDTVSLQDNSVSVDPNPRGKRSSPLERKRELNAFRVWGDESISKFSNWFRKRGQKFFSWGGKRDPKFFSWGGKRDPRFFSWGGKRDPKFISWNEKTNLDMVQPANKNNYSNSLPFKDTVSILDAEGIEQVLSSRRGEIIPLNLPYPGKNDKSDQMLPTDEMNALGETGVMHDHDNNDKHVVTIDQTKSDEDVDVAFPDNFQPTFNDAGRIKPLSNREGIIYPLHSEDEDDNISFFDNVDSDYKKEFPSVSEK